MIPKLDWLGFSEMNGDNVCRLQRNCTAFADKLCNDSVSLEFEMEMVWIFNLNIPIDHGHFQKTSDPHKFSGLRKVFVEFAKYAHGTPSYDRLYQTIVEEIENYEKQKKQPAFLSWLTTAQDKRNAIAARKTIPSISAIRNPFGLDEVERKPVECEFFSEFYHAQLNPGGTSRKN